MTLGGSSSPCQPSFNTDSRHLSALLLRQQHATHSEPRHAESLHGIKGYCRVRTTEQLVAELESQQPNTAIA